MITIGKMRFYLIDMLRGTNVIQQLTLLEQQQYLSTTDLSTIANEKLNRLSAKARLSVAFYKQFDQHIAFPELTKEMIRQQTNDFIDPTYKGKLIKKSTGGSTGIPLYYYTTSQAQSFMWAGIIHAWKIVGYVPGDKVAFVTGTALAKNDWKHNLFYKLMNIQILSAYHLDNNTIDKYIHQLIYTKTKIIYGYPTALNEIALYILTHKNLEFPDLKGIVVTSEVLQHKHRVNIENAFKVVVRNQYGCNDAGISAFECEYGKLHLINTAAAYHINQNGVLVSTNLVNEGFLFINYNTGDSIKMSNHHMCSCKRGYPVIDHVQGRDVDMIIDKNGKKIHSAFFSILFRIDESIEQFQIQYNEDTIQLSLKVNAFIFNEKRQNEYLRLIKNAMYFDNYIINVNQPFLNTANAKHKYVIDKRGINIYNENLV